MNYGTLFNDCKAICIGSDFDKIYALDLKNGTRKMLVNNLERPKYECTGLVHIMDKAGQFIIEKSQAHIYKYEGKYFAKDIQIKDSVAKYLKRQKRNPFTNFIVSDRVGLTNGKQYAFGFSCLDSTGLNGKRPFMKYPAAAIFDFKTERFKFIGSMPDTFTTNRVAYFLGSLVYDDTLNNQLLVGFTNSLDLTIYDYEGKQIKKSNVPDSIKASFPMYDHSLSSEKLPTSFMEKSWATSSFVSRKYHTTLRTCRLNENLLAVVIIKHETSTYILFDNDLNYVDNFTYGGHRIGFSHYEGKESYFTGFTADPDRKYERQPVVFSLK